MSKAPRKQRKERSPEDRHLKTYLYNLLDTDAKRELEQLREDLARGEKK